MTKEEKLKLIRKLDTQLDRAESYLRQLSDAEPDQTFDYINGLLGRGKAVLESYYRIEQLKD